MVRAAERRMSSWVMTVRLLPTAVLEPPPPFLQALEENRGARPTRRDDDLSRRRPWDRDDASVGGVD